MTKSIQSISKELDSLSKALFSVGKTSEARRVLQIIKVAYSGQAGNASDREGEATYEEVKRFVERAGSPNQATYTEGDPNTLRAKEHFKQVGAGKDGQVLQLEKSKLNATFMFDRDHDDTKILKITLSPQDGYVWSTDKGIEVTSESEYAAGQQEGAGSGVDQSIGSDVNLNTGPIALGRDNPEPEEAERFKMALQRSPNYRDKFYAITVRGFIVIVAVNDYSDSDEVYTSYKAQGATDGVEWSEWSTIDAAGDPSSLDYVKAIFEIKKDVVNPQGDYSYKIVKVKDGVLQGVVQESVQEANDGFINRAFRKARLLKFAAAPAVNPGSIVFSNPTPAQQTTQRTRRQIGPWKGVQDKIIEVARALDKYNDIQPFIVRNSLSDGYWGDKTAKAYNALTDSSEPARLTWSQGKAAELIKKLNALSAGSSESAPPTGEATEQASVEPISPEQMVRYLSYRDELENRDNYIDNNMGKIATFDRRREDHARWAQRHTEFGPGLSEAYRQDIARYPNLSAWMDRSEASLPSLSQLREHFYIGESDVDNVRYILQAKEPGSTAAEAMGIGKGEFFYVTGSNIMRRLEQRRLDDEVPEGVDQLTRRERLSLRAARRAARKAGEQTAKQNRREERRRVRNYQRRSRSRRPWRLRE